MKRRDVIIAASASEDMVAILEHSLERFGIHAARDLDHQLDAAIRSLDRFGTRRRIVPELRQAGIVDYREILVKPFRIIFRIEHSEVWVVAVLDGRRNVEEVLFERVRR
jgi:toxin ParE1/3/4